jgi:uncharacterized protein (DUF427 family)
MEPSGWVDRPDYRVDIHRQRNRVTVLHEDTQLADSTAALFVAEQDHGLVVYLPRADVRTDLLSPLEMTTRCPFKGTATYWGLGDSTDPIAWEYATPYPEVAPLRDHIAFYQDRVDLRLGAAPPSAFLASLAATAKEQR